jgi:precorrin-3B synthase
MMPLTARARTSPDESRPSRRSACPGLFRFAPAQDGEICRVKLPCGRLTAAQAAAVADAAACFGSGVLDATNRCNLQIRGVRADREAALVDTLIAAGLGPLTEGGDDVRNVMVSPTAGLDQGQDLDTRPLADRLLATLQTRVAYHALSPKFSILLDGGEQVAAIEHPHDIWLAAVPDAGGPPRFAFGFAGCPPLPEGRSSAAGAVEIDHAHDLVTASLDLFLELAAARPEMTRMRHLLMETTADQLVDDLARRIPFPIVRGRAVMAWRGKARPTGGHIGSHAQRQSGMNYVGAIPPLGRLTAATLQSIGQIASELGDGSLRFTPWRSVLLPNVRTSRAAETVRRLEEVGLVCRNGDPLATMIACSGSAGCASGLAATQRDGLALAAHLRSRRGTVAVHLSGCAKSCAAAMPAPATLVGVADGRYDLFVRRADGPSRFGRRLASGISIDQAVELLADAGE